MEGESEDCGMLNMKIKQKQRENKEENFTYYQIEYNILKEYFNECFDDLTSKINNENNSSSLPKISFISYLGLPCFIGESIFNTFIQRYKEKEKTNLGSEGFCKGMIDLYFSSSIDNFIKILFDVFDFDFDGVIFKEDVELVLIYLFSEINLNANGTLRQDSIENIFSSSNDLNFTDFVKKIKNDSTLASKKLVYDIKHQLHIKSPFIKESLRFYESKKRKINISYIKSEQFSTSSNFENIYPSYPEIIVYKYSQDLKLAKTKLVLVNQEIFSFTFSKSKNEFIYDKVHPLSGIYVAEYDDTQICNKKFYPFALLKKWGDQMTNLRNIFFTQSESERFFFLNKIRENSKNKNLDINYSNFYEDYVELYSLGKGQYGHVVLCESKKNCHSYVAVKKIQKTNFKREVLELIYREIDIMQFLKMHKHKSIVSPIDFYEDNSNIYIVMEYVNSGSLQSILTSGHLNKDKRPKESQVRIIFKQIAEGLQFLEKIGVIHRDIKAENILLSFDSIKCTFQAKISDFGLCKIIGKSEKTDESYGTLVYTAPEIVMQKAYNNKVDMWSLGVLMYYSITGVYPFEGQSNEVARKIVQSKLFFPKNIVISKNLKSLIEACLKKNPRERIDVNHFINSDCIVV